jgi:hypothetical protein
MVALGMVLSVVWQKDKYLSLFALVFVGLCSFLLFQNMPEKPIILKATDKLTAETQIGNMIALLQTFNINVKDERKFNQLIERAKKGQGLKEVWNLFKTVIIMIFTGLLPNLSGSNISEFLLSQKIFKEVHGRILIGIAIGLIFICMMVLPFVVYLLTHFFPSKRRLLDSFISDVEDIKLFPKIVRSIIIRERNEAKEKASRQKIIKALKSKFAGNIASKRRKPDGPCVPEHAIKARKEGVGTVGDPQALGHKKPLQSAEQNRR